MSYDICIENQNHETVAIPERHDLKGGTYCIGGTNRLELNVTYNYSDIFCRLFGENGIHFISGKDIRETIIPLHEAIKKLGDVVPDENYWKSCDGNVKVALENLCLLADFALMYFPKDKMVWKIH